MEARTTPTKFLHCQDIKRKLNMNKKLNKIDSKTVTKEKLVGYYHCKNNETT